MAVTGVNNSVYTSYYDNSVKRDAAKESGVTTSTVELKTSTAGVTKTEQIKTGYRNVNDYSKYLQGKYSYMNTGTTSMQGIPTTVSVSGAFLKKCMNDPEKAKYLEENLAAIPDCVKSLNNCVRMAPGSPVVTYATYKIDENGNISIMSGSTNDPDGKIARENAEKKAKEDREKEEKLAEQRAKKAHQYSVKMEGTNVTEVTKKVVDSIISSELGIPLENSYSSFDMKA